MLNAVNVRKANTNVTEVVANGYNVLRNVGYDANSWYLDNLNVNWSKVYANEPCAGVPLWPTTRVCNRLVGATSAAVPSC